MINIIRYKPLRLNSNRFKFSLCLSVDKFEKKDRLVVLHNPRVLYKFNEELGKDQINMSGSTLTVDILDVNSNYGKHTTNSSFRSDKKNRNSVIADDLINKRKNKVVGRVNKKKKSKRVSLNTNDLFIQESDFVQEVNIESANLSVAKPSKIKKQKKQEKLYKNSLDHDKSQIYSLSNLISNDNTSNTKINKEINISKPLSIKQLANKLYISEASIIRWLFLQGISVTINQVVDMSIAIKVAEYYGFIVKKSDLINTAFDSSAHKLLPDSKNHSYIKRAPIITVFGHVDHGKTSLLDCIRNTHLVSKEAGGITQSISAYEVYYSYLSSKEKLIFLDTPGHEAFASMRLRGAEVTDIAVLVVAVDDGIKPQTVESINYILLHRIPCIIAINKVDKQEYSLEKIKNELAKYNIVHSGDNNQNMIVDVSALTGYNVPVLLDSICKLSNSLNLITDSSSNPQGVIIESYLDRQIGPIATLVIKSGNLKIGDIVIAGDVYGRIKAIKNSRGLQSDTAYASAIVQISGFSSVPPIGLEFCIAKNEKLAKNIVTTYSSIENNSKDLSLLNSRVTLKSYNANINLKTVNIILKADTQGSVEAIISAFSKIPQDKVQINLISCGPGSVYETDINLAVTSRSIILGFNVHIFSNIRSAAQNLGIILKDYNIIYDLLSYVQNYMLNLVPLEYKEYLIGHAVVRTVFNINKGNVAGCLVDSGILKQSTYIKVYRNNSIVYKGHITSLRHLKNNVKEVLEGYECGIMCSDYNEWEASDTLEAFDILAKEKVL